MKYFHFYYRTNLPAKIMNFPDYQRLNAEEPCCVTHQEVRTYLQNYAKHFDLLKYIQVRANIFHISFINTRKFLITYY